MIEFYQIELSIAVVHLLNSLDYLRYITQKPDVWRVQLIHATEETCRKPESHRASLESIAGRRARATRLCPCVCVLQMLTMPPVVELSADDNDDTDYLSSHYCGCYLRTRVIIVILRLALFLVHITYRVLYHILYISFDISARWFTSLLGF